MILLHNRIFVLQCEKTITLRVCCLLFFLQVGRTARGRDGRGRALLMLMPEELGFLKYLKQAKVGHM